MLGKRTPAVEGLEDGGRGVERESSGTRMSEAVRDEDGPAARDGGARSRRRLEEDVQGDREVEEKVERGGEIGRAHV